MKRKEKILVLYLQYFEKYADSFSVLHSLMKELGFDVYYCIIDNKQTSQRVENISNNIVRITGDNSSGEFSGWQRGIEFIKKSNIQFDVVLLMNDSFLVYGKNFIQSANFPYFVDEACRRKIITGQVDRSENTHTLYDLDVTRWIRANATLLSKSVLDDIDSMVAIDEKILNNFIPLTYPGVNNSKSESAESAMLSFFKKDATMNEPMKEDIIVYLTKIWHSKFEISAETWPLFRMKVKALLNEALFTAKLKHMGIDIREVDTERLSNLIDTISQLPPDWHGAGSVSPSVLRGIVKYTEQMVAISNSLETGSGKTTLLLSHLSHNHLVFTKDDGGSMSKVKESPLFNAKNTTFIEGPTQATLPGYAFTQKVQIALIDGPHGYPFPDLEYYYLYPLIDEGGLLVIDDIQIPSIGRMLDIVRADDMFDLLEIIGNKTAFLRRSEKQSVDPYGDGWWLQGYNKDVYKKMLQRSRLRAALTTFFIRTPNFLKKFIPTRLKKIFLGIIEKCL